MTECFNVFAGSTNDEQTTRVQEQQTSVVNNVTPSPCTGSLQASYMEIISNISLREVKNKGLHFQSPHTAD